MANHSCLNTNKFTKTNQDFHDIVLPPREMIVIATLSIRLSVLD